MRQKLCWAILPLVEHDGILGTSLPEENSFKTPCGFCQLRYVLSIALLPWEGKTIASNSQKPIFGCLPLCYWVNYFLARKDCKQIFGYEPALLTSPLTFQSFMAYLSCNQIDWLWTIKVLLATSFVHEFLCNFLDHIRFSIRKSSCSEDVHRSMNAFYPVELTWKLII